MKIHLDPSVSIEPRCIGGLTTYVLHHASLGTFFALGPEEYAVVSLVDGQRSLPEVTALAADRGLDWSAEDVAQLMAELIRQKLATVDQATTDPHSTTLDSDDGVENTDRKPTATVAQESIALTSWALSKLISQRIPLLPADGLARLGARWLRPLLHPIGFSGWCIAVASAMLIAWVGRADLMLELQRMFDPQMWILLAFVWCVLKCVHEWGHAIVASHQGVRVGRAGVMFFLLAPLAYVELSQAWSIRQPHRRARIAMGGVYFELLIAAAAIWLWAWLPDGYAKHLAAQVFVLAGPATLLVNANPLLRLDGYYVMTDLLDIPNLRMHGRKQLASICNHWLLGLPRSVTLLHGWRRPLATWHAAASIVFQVVWMSGLVLAVSQWAKGLGVVLAVAATTLWAVIPLARWTAKHMVNPSQRGVRRRVVFCLGVMVTIVQFLASAPSPVQRRVPVVVRYRDEQIVRAPADAFVTHVYVSSGDEVMEGMLLMELESESLEQQIDQVREDLAVSQRRAIQLRGQREVAAAMAEQARAESSQRRLEELASQLSSLQVHANRDGVVITRRTQQRMGRFVGQGQELIRVCDPHDKELLLVVPESDLQAFAVAAQRSLPAPVRLRGGQHFQSRPLQPQPQAKRQLPHPALSALAGGSIAVEQDPDHPDNEMRMVQPHLVSTSTLSPAVAIRVRAGQTGTIRIGDTRTLVSRIYESLAR